MAPGPESAVRAGAASMAQARGSGSACAPIASAGLASAEIAAQHKGIAAAEAGSSSSDDDALTLVCLDDGTTVRVPLSVAAAESKLLHTMLEDVDGSEGEAVLNVPLLSGEQATSFATFLRDPLSAPTQSLLSNGDGTGSFTALYNAASYLIVPRWQLYLAKAWESTLLELTGLGDHEAVKAMVEREEATLDPDVSPLLTMLTLEASHVRQYFLIPRARALTAAL